MGTIGERLKAERREQGLTQEALAEAAGVSKQAISQIETGVTGNPEAATLEPICRRLNVNARWLLKGHGPKHPSGAANEGDWSDILGYAQAVGMGNGIEADEYAETHKLKFRARSLARKGLFPNNLAVMYGEGESMLPRIRQGDAILFDTSDRSPQHNSIFIVQVGREVYAKRCLVLDDLVFFDSLNPDAGHGWAKPRRMDNKRSPIQILGRVRWIGSWQD